MRPSRRAFTLVEIMIVTLIVAILSGLAIFVIGRIKDRAARSMIENTLRQLYQAKEFYFTETGDLNPVTVAQLSRQGYVKKSQFTALTEHGSLETKMGWRYNIQFRAGEPIYARLYANRAGTGTPLETIWYPGPPSGDADSSAAGGTVVTTPPAVQQPVVQPVVQPPVQQPPGVIQPQVPPSTTSPVAPNAGPTGTVSTTPGNPPATATGGQPPVVAPTGQNNAGTNPPANHSPGNSAFGHSHQGGKKP